MEPVRKYGNPPCSVVLVHGGPGAWGDMEPVARELSGHAGVLEPMQRAKTVDGLIAEMKRDLDENAVLPVVIAGHSWGAWLSLLFAAENPDYARKIILISSGPVLPEYAPMVMKTRLSRLAPDERVIFLNGIRMTGDQDGISRLLEKTDAFDPLPQTENTTCFMEESFRSVWNEADEMRKTGELASRIGKVACPVIAIHGDYDPHPADGVRVLSGILKDFRFCLLDKCGHYPWKEKWAKNGFFQILKEELA